MTDTSTDDHPWLSYLSSYGKSAYPQAPAYSPFGVLNPAAIPAGALPSPGNTPQNTAGLGALSQNMQLPNDFMALSQGNGGGTGPVPQPPPRPTDLFQSTPALQQAQQGGGSISPPLPPSRPYTMPSASQFQSASPQAQQAQGSNPIGAGFQNFFGRVMDPRGPIGALIHAGMGVGQAVAPVITQAGGGLKDILDGIFHQQA